MAGGTKRKAVYSWKQVRNMVKLFSAGDRHMQTARSHNKRTKQKRSKQCK